MECRKISKLISCYRKTINFHINTYLLLIKLIFYCLFIIYEYTTQCTITQKGTEAMEAIEASMWTSLHLKLRPYPQPMGSFYGRAHLTMIEGGCIASVALHLTYQ